MTGPHRDGNVTFPVTQFQAMLRGQYAQGCIDTRTQYLPILLDVISELRLYERYSFTEYEVIRRALDRAEARLREVGESA